MAHFSSQINCNITAEPGVENNSLNIDSLIKKIYIYKYHIYIYRKRERERQRERERVRERERDRERSIDR